MRTSTRMAIGIVVGALVGLLLGALVYALLVPVMEEAGGIVEEFQGLAWNLVPLGTVAGGVVGWLLTRSRGDR